MSSIGILPADYISNWPHVYGHGIKWSLCLQYIFLMVSSSSSSLHKKNTVCVGVSHLFFDVIRLKPSSQPCPSITESLSLLHFCSLMKYF